MNGNPYYEPYFQDSNTLQHYGVAGMQWREHKRAQHELMRSEGYRNSETYRKSQEAKRSVKNAGVSRGVQKARIKVSGSSKVSKLAGDVVDAGLYALDEFFGIDHKAANAKRAEARYDYEKYREAQRRANR